MKKLRLNNLLTALVLVCTAAFWSCSSDDVDSQGPFIKAEPNALTFNASGEELIKSIAIESNRDWTAAFLESGVDSWITIDNKQGSGNGTIKVTVLPNDGAERTATLKLTASVASVSVKITQFAEGGTPIGEVIYQENCGQDVEKVNDRWPYVDQFEGWERGGKLSQAAVTYTGSSANVSNSGPLYQPGEGTPFSGAPYVGMSTAGSQFIISNINITGVTSFTFKFGALFQSAYSGAPTFGEIAANSFGLNVSLDGTNWVPMTYTTAKQGAGNWYLITTEFKVPAGSEKLYIKYTTANLGASQGYRFDDFTLYEGGNGSLLDPNGGGDPGASGDVDPYPTTVVTSFTETFDAVVNNKPFTSDQWGFCSSDPAWPSDAYLGWHGRVFNNTDKYLACAPYNSSLSKVVAYAIMSPFNVKDAGSKVLNFDLAWFYQNADDSKIEVVASTDFAGNVNNATWTVLKDCSFASGSAMNEWVEQSVDLAANYGTSSKVYVAFRYTGKDITYRIDNIAFGTDLAISFGTPAFSATTIKVNEAIVGGKITIPYSNAVGSETYNVTVAVSGDAAAGILPIDVAVPVSLTAGNGVIELPILGTPLTAGSVTFTINGITELTDNTATANVAGDVVANYIGNVELPKVSDSKVNYYYAEKVNIDGSQYPLLKLGKSKTLGKYTTVGALPVTGNITLSFYATGWNSGTVSLKITVNGGGTIGGESSKTIALNNNAGAKESSPYTMTLTSDDYYLFDLEGVTASTTLTFESVAGTDTRAFLIGINVE